MPSITSFGGSGNGTTDNTTALTNALNSLPAAGGVITFPAGKYLFSQSITYTLKAKQSVSLVGEGADATVLYWPASFGIIFVYTATANRLECSSHFRDLTFTTAQPGNNVAISLVNNTGVAVASGNDAVNDIVRVYFRGDGAYFTSNYWDTGVRVSGTSNINVLGCSFTGRAASAGTGISVSGTSTNIPVVINVISSIFNSLDTGLLYGAYAQGVFVSECNFTNCIYGVQSPAGSPNLLQLNVTNSQFACTSYGVVTFDPIIDVILSGNLFLVNSGITCIQINASSGTIISGNTFAPNASTGGYGVKISGAVDNQGAMITGNAFNGMNTGVWLQAGSKNSNVQSNIYHSNITNVRNDGVGNITGGGSI